jgi:hypothetical protein
MPKKTENEAVEFGTGLRGKLEGRRGDSLSPPPPIPETDAEAQAAEADLLDGEPDADEGEAEGPQASGAGASETEQLWSELEDALSREEALRKALSEQIEAQQQRIAFEQELMRRAGELEERERELAEQAKAIVAETRRIEAEAKSAAGKPSKRTGESARTYLRRRAEEQGELLWQVFAEALEATRADGSADHRTRLLAASTLLAEAYDDGAVRGDVEAAKDELAGMRDRKLKKQSS